ncbi:MAG: transglycosylase SLT domain-containing protein [Candidatus Gastranaerophilales bacterium]|nr:transglycosylase SLT domain-containing protein [Candidatus Gastranaerophilales bacterium]
MKYLKYILGVLLVVVPAAVTVLVYNDKITQNSPLYYKQGVHFYNDGDYQNAYYNFGKIKWISPLYPMAIYKQAKSAQKVGDYQTAILKYERFLEKMPNSVFDLKARLNLAKSYYYAKQYQESKVQFEKIRKTTSNLGTEEVYYLGLIEKRMDKVKAAKYFRKYLEFALAGKALNNNYILAAAEELSALGLELSNSDKQLVGIAYYKNNKYKEALNYFSKLPISNCWDYLVLSNHYVGNKVVAKKLIETGLPLYTHFADEGNLHNIYDIYTSYMIGSRMKNWNLLYKIVKDKDLNGEDYVIYKLANISQRDKANLLYKDLVARFPDSNYAPESLWNIFWNTYRKKDYKTAEQLAIQHLKTYKKVESTPRIAFWLAKTALKQGKNSEANNYLSRLASKYPDNYYGLRASNLLEKKNDFWTTNVKNKLPEGDEEIEFPISVSELNIKDLKLINTLFEMGDYEIWLDADFSSGIIDSWFAQKRGKKSSSIVMARDSIDKMSVKPPYISASYKLAYPRYWVDEINIAGQKLGIDPYLIISLIREESYFNEHARSKSNAIGLMQIMPSTANYMADKLSFDSKSLAAIESPRTNMYLGCNYLRYLKERFNNDLMVIAAYNGGEGSVSKWIRLYGTEDLDEFVEKIPYDETRNYVKKVFKTYHMYQKVYK